MIQDARYMIQDARYKIQDAGYRMHDAGYRMHDRAGGILISDYGFWIADCEFTGCEG